MGYGLLPISIEKEVVKSRKNEKRGKISNLVGGEGGVGKYCGGKQKRQLQ